MAIHILLICFLMTLKVMHVGFVSAFLGTRASLLRTRCEKIVAHTKSTAPRKRQVFCPTTPLLLENLRFGYTQQAAPTHATRYEHTFKTFHEHTHDIGRLNTCNQLYTQFENELKHSRYTFRASTVNQLYRQPKHRQPVIAQPKHRQSIIAQPKQLQTLINAG